MYLRFPLLLATLFCLSATASQAFDVDARANIGVFDKYLWRGIDLSDSTAVTQGAVELSAGGFTLGAWGNAQLEDDGLYDGGQVNEVDLTVDYTFNVTELATVSVGNITYILDDLEDTNEAYAGVTVNTLLSPTLTVYYDWDEAEENGLFYTASVSHTFDPCSYAAVNVGALVSYNDTSDYSVYYVDATTGEEASYSDWHNYELSASVDLKVTDGLTITPSVLYSSPISDEAKLAIDSEWLAGLSLTYSLSF
ncbi:MAG: hypothetical protein FDZ69_06165 [Deltaproteobacteria bacterium]|nr:MAG: hypothetical protein FDZ69_06165 [Deltaproteobacteria bacterium]